MPTVQKWSNVVVSIQSALAAAKTITGITKAPTAVATSTAHGYIAGDFVLITAQGMYQVDSRVFRVGTVAANTFELEGEDSTLYATFTSGSAQLITFGTNMTTATGLTAAGGDFAFIDVTTIHDNIRKQIPGLPSAADYAFENIWDVADPALIAFKLAADNQLLRAVRFAFAGGAGPKVLFNAYMGCTLLPQGNAQDKVTTKSVATMFGRPTIYQS